MNNGGRLLFTDKLARPYFRIIELWIGYFKNCLRTIGNSLVVAAIVSAYFTQVPLNSSISVAIIGVIMILIGLIK